MANAFLPHLSHTISILLTDLLYVSQPSNGEQLCQNIFQSKITDNEIKAGVSNNVNNRR